MTEEVSFTSARENSPACTVSPDFSDHLARTCVGAWARSAYHRVRSTAATYLFDRRYGVHTEREMKLEELGKQAPDRCDYMPYRVGTLQRVLPLRSVSQADVFLDMGSGMGRVVLQAALHYRFKRVIGVEVSRELNEIARENIERNRHRITCQAVELIEADAQDFPIPDDVSILFLFNPFTGHVFERFLTNLLASIQRNPRPVTLIYANPREEAVLLAHERARLIAARRGWRPSAAWSRSNSTRVYRIDPCFADSPTGVIPRPRSSKRS